jgi:hypothetical protein
MDGVRIYRGLPKDGMTYPFEGWLTKEWAELRQAKDRLDDAAFLQAFEPIAKRFQDRRPHLDHLRGGDISIVPSLGGNSRHLQVD